jgi:centrin-1
MTPRLLEGDSKENIDRIFALFDTEKTGFISVKDLRRIAHDIGGDISEQDLEDMIKRADKDLDGLVSRDEFFELVSGVPVQ